jgi:eukaryotic-like serine/threonine-protein kinase
VDPKSVRPILWIFELKYDGFGALAAYKDFLDLWKEADPDIPILKDAKAEYAKLR